MIFIPHLSLLCKIFNILRKLPRPIPRLTDNSRKGRVGEPETLKTERSGKIIRPRRMSFKENWTVIRVTSRKMRDPGFWIQETPARIHEVSIYPLLDETISIPLIRPRWTLFNFVKSASLLPSPFGKFVCDSVSIAENVMWMDNSRFKRVLQ